VVLVDIQKDKLEQVADRLAGLGIKVLAYEADVTDSTRAARVVEEVVGSVGRLDHLVNNAGITRDSLLLRMKEEDWDLVLQVNLKGIFNFSRAALKPMFTARYGRMVNIASVVGQMGNFGQTNYAASKAGLIGFPNRWPGKWPPGESRLIVWPRVISPLR